MASSVTVAEGSNQVLTASKEQSDGVKQINISMGQLDKTTQENAATAEETARTSEKLSDLTIDLDHIVKNLTELVSGEKSRPVVDDGPDPQANVHSISEITSKASDTKSEKGNKAPADRPPMASGGENWEEL